MEEIEKIKEYKALYNKRLQELEQEFEPIEKEMLELTKTYLEKNAIPKGTTVIFNDVNDWINEEGVIIDHLLTSDYRIRYYFDTDNFNDTYCGFDTEFRVKNIESIVSKLLNRRNFLKRTIKLHNDDSDKLHECDVKKDVFLKHLSKLKSPYAEQAIENYDDEFVKGVNINFINDVEEALNLAFKWDKSPQGEKYWNNVYDYIKHYLK